MQPSDERVGDSCLNRGRGWLVTHYDTKLLFSY